MALNHALYVPVLLFSLATIHNAYAETQRKCTATFPKGQKAVLIMEGREPFSYRSGSYYNDTPIRSGNTIIIQDAKFKISSETDKVIKGRWSLNGSVSLTFFCK